jgi:hypothetical protein
VDGSGPRLCLVAGCGISSFEFSGSGTRLSLDERSNFLNMLMYGNIFLHNITKIISFYK